MVEIEKCFEFHKDDRIVVGCSSGPDSMALVDSLVKIRDKYNLFIVVAHVNYNVRDVSTTEANYVRDYCKDNNLVFEYLNINKDSYSNDNFEFEARRIRYRFYKKLVNEYKLDYVMTAHQGDDLIETIMMKIVRGSNLNGYAGFKKEIKIYDFKIIRPLIYYTKQELIDYCDENKVKYYIDESNDDVNYTRNRFRKNILPLLKKENEKIHKKFIKYSDTLVEANEFISRERDKALDRCYVDNKIIIDKFKLEDEYIQKNIISYLIDKFYDNDLFLLNDKHVDLIIKLIYSEKANNYLDLPDDVKAIKEYNYFYLCKDEKKSNYEYEFNDKILIDNGHTIIKVDNEESNSNYICRLNSKEIKLPIIVRNRRKGDFIYIKNLNGKKKIKDIFIDSKIPSILRGSWPIVTDSDNNILWVPGIKKSVFDKSINDSYDIILKYQ